MIWVLAVFCYITITTWMLGNFSLGILCGREYLKKAPVTGVIMAGLVSATVFAEIFSLFAGVGLWANIVLILTGILGVLIFRKEITENISFQKTSNKTKTLVKAGVLVLLLVLFAYGTSRGYLHYDTALYHSQSIRWIEEYGVVKGLGNLHSRLAYNSASFALSALYSLAFLGGQSYHCVAGFLALLLTLVCLKGLKKHRPGLSDIARVMCMYYVYMIYDEMISPASDYFMVLIVFYVAITWLEQAESSLKSGQDTYGLLSLLCLFNTTVKLSGGVLVLLALFPGICWIKRKELKKTVAFVGAGILVLVPFLIRNVILSGWLLYPFTAIDLFQVKWKIPKGMAEYDAAEIKAYGRGVTVASDYGAKFSDWFANWIRNLSATDKVFFVLAVMGIFILAGLCIYLIIKKQRKRLETLVFPGVMALCFLFWLFSAPLIRYGGVFMWLTGTLAAGALYLQLLRERKIGRIIFYGAAALLLLYKQAAWTMEVAASFTPEYLLEQKDYENYPVEEYELHGVTFYYPVNGDQTGYDAFPSSPVKAGDIFLGDTIKEGFTPLE